MKSPVIPEFQNNFQFLNQELRKSLVIAADNACINRIAIVGGFLRDELIRQLHNEPTKKIQDIDLIIEGDPSKLVNLIKEQLGNTRVVITRQSPVYQTIELKIDGLKIDIARARKENYPKPAHNPEITPSSIEEDLYRRDFTINSMALDLRTFEFIDPYEGYKAILSRNIDFIHDESASEDPTRVFRASRYAARLNFDLTSKCINQINSTINSWPWDWNHNQPPSSAPPALAIRLRMEIELLLNEEESTKAIRSLQEWHALKLLDQGLQIDQSWKRRLIWASRLGVNPLTAWISAATHSALLAERLQLPKTEQNLLIETNQIVDHLDSLDESGKAKNWGPYQWCKEIEYYEWKASSIAIAICIGIPRWKLLLRWWGRWRLIKSQQSAQDLLNNGWVQGPELGRELKRLRDIELEQILN